MKRFFRLDSNHLTTRLTALLAVICIALLAIGCQKESVASPASAEPQAAPESSPQPSTTSPSPEATPAPQNAETPPPARPQAKPAQTSSVTPPASEGSIFADPYGSVLELTAISKKRNSSTLKVNGTVKNVSQKALFSVQLYIHFQDASGKVFRTDHAPLSHPDLDPGQSSEFSLFKPWDPEIRNFKMEFQNSQGKSLPFRVPSNFR